MQEKKNQRIDSAGNIMRTREFIFFISLQVVNLLLV